jgi:hypothetical protein
VPAASRRCFFFWVDVSGDEGRRKDERSTTNGGEGRIRATPPEPSSHERTVGICESAGLAGLKKRVAAVCRSPRLRRTGRVLSPDRSNLNTILPLQVVRTFFFFFANLLQNHRSTRLLIGMVNLFGWPNVPFPLLAKLDKPIGPMHNDCPFF